MARGARPWQRPISRARHLAELFQVSEGQVSDGQLAEGVPYWVESRPAEGGRNVVVTTAAGGGVRELTPAGFNARTRVHEYGGSPYVMSRGTVYFSNFSDQRLYSQRPGEKPVALTPEGYRYADFELDASGRRLFCVREDHTGGGEPKNAIVVLDIGVADPAAGTVLFDGSDFVAYPRVSPDGRRIAWIAWNHPDMPWDRTTLYVANLTVGSGLSDITAVAGDRSAAEEIPGATGNRSGAGNPAKRQRRDVGRDVGRYGRICRGASVGHRRHAVFHIRSLELVEPIFLQRWARQ